MSASVIQVGSCAVPGVCGPRCMRSRCMRWGGVGAAEAAEPYYPLGPSTARSSLPYAYGPFNTIALHHLPLNTCDLTPAHSHF